MHRNEAARVLAKILFVGGIASSLDTIVDIIDSPEQFTDMGWMRVRELLASLGDELEGS